MNLSPFYLGHFGENKDVNQEHKYFIIFDPKC